MDDRACFRLYYSKGHAAANKVAPVFEDSQKVNWAASLECRAESYKWNNGAECGNPPITTVTGALAKRLSDSYTELLCRGEQGRGLDVYRCARTYAWSM